MVQIPNAPRLGDMPSGEPVPEGIYAVRVSKEEFKISKSVNKTPMIEAQLTIFGPESQEEYHGRKLFENMMLSGEGQFKTRQFLEATGHDDDFVLEDTDQVHDLEVGVVVQIEQERKELDESGRPTGKVFPARNKVAKFIPLSEVE